MVTIYVIEMIIEDDVVISHIFLTQSKAISKVVDILRDNYSTNSIQIVKKQINDETGISEDEVVHKTDLKKYEEDTDED